MIADEDGVTVVSSVGSERFDYVIFCTGFTAAVLDRPELAAFADRALRWGDRIGSEGAAKHPEIARFPYFGQAFELLSRPESSPGAIGNLHVFDWTAMLSLGPLGGDIPGVDLGATRIATAIAADLFVADAQAHLRDLRDFAELELEPTRYVVSR